MTLDEALLEAHDRDDREALVTLYARAADEALTTDAACFYLTHAYIFALEMDHPDTATLYHRLKAYGRV